jgi:uncharacterized protein (TIGR03435 family)
MRRLVWILAAGSIAVWAQPPAKPQSAFDVISVKVNRSNDPRTFRIDPLANGRFHATNTPVKRVLTLAYGLGYPEILGGPAWLESDGYDFEAKAEGQPTRVELVAMLQALLENRFQMKAHRETREVPVYALVVAKGGSKLPDAQEGASGVRFSSKGLTAKSTTMPILAQVLNEATGRPVMDETGLKGKYDFTLEWHGNDPSIFVALPEQLGLRLETRKAPVEYLVIEHIERPAEN